MQQQAANIAEVSMEIEIDAPPATVWKSLTDNISDWWPDDFFAGGEKGKRRYVLEPHPGGRMYEDWENGGGLLWGTVVTIDPDSLLQVIGSTFSNWGGPNQSYTTWKLTPKGSGTTLAFSDSIVGRLGDMADKTKGWDFLLRALQAHAQGTDAPVWQ